MDSCITSIDSKAARRILLVDDHETLRTGLKVLGSDLGRPRIEWLEAGTLGNALELFATQSAIDLVLLDLKLPDSHGLNALVRFRQAFPAARVAVFSAVDDEFVIRQVMALGAVAFIAKSGSAKTTVERIWAALDAPSVNSGTRVMNLSSFGARQSVLQPTDQSAVSLTPTQLTVLELVLAGMSNQEIANSTSLALGTVKNIVSSLLLAMDARSRSHLISTFK